MEWKKRRGRVVHRRPTVAEHATGMWSRQSPLTMSNSVNCRCSENGTHVETSKWSKRWRFPPVCCHAHPGPTCVSVHVPGAKRSSPELKKEIVRQARLSQGQEGADQGLIFVLCSRVCVSVNAKKHWAFAWQETDLVTQECPKRPTLWCMCRRHQGNRKVRTDASEDQECRVRITDAPLVKLKWGSNARGIHPDLNPVTAFHMSGAPTRNPYG